MKDDNIYTNDNIEEDSIDIFALIKNIWRGRRLIIKISISFFFIGCIVAILSPVIYTSETTFVPQVTDNQSSASRGLGSLASLAGIKFNTIEESNDSYLSPLLYTKIIDSEEFSLELLEEELIDRNFNKFTIKDYLLSKKRSINFNPITLIKKYTIDLFFENKTNEINTDILSNYNFIDIIDYNLISSFRQKFSIELNEKEGYIKVLASDKDAFISSQLVDKITKSLQSKIIKIRTNKVKERLEFSKEQYYLKQKEFDLLQKKLAEFKDSNKNISTASFMSELQKLESEYQLQQSILINLASEYNNNKIKLNRDTPIFSVIDEVSIPNVKSAPKRFSIVVLYSIVGLIISLIYILLREPVLDLIKKIIN